MQYTMLLEHQPASRQAYIPQFSLLSTFKPRTSPFTSHRKRPRRIFIPQNLPRCQTPTPQKDFDDPSFQVLTQDIRTYISSTPSPGASPLAYTNLGKNGRTDLISRIMEFGGYIKVSEHLGLPVDQSEFIPLPPTVSNSSLTFLQYEQGASIALGRDLEKRLASEQSIPSTTNLSTTRSTSSGRSSDDVPSAEQIQLENESIVPPVVDKQVPRGERFKLTGEMKAEAVLLMACVALGFGRASVGLVDEGVMQGAKLAAQVLGIAHVVVAAYVGGVLAPKLGRNALLWLIKSLVGGISSIRYLRSLGSL